MSFNEQKRLSDSFKVSKFRLGTSRSYGTIQEVTSNEGKSEIENPASLGKSCSPLDSWIVEDGRSEIPLRKKNIPESQFSFSFEDLDENALLEVDAILEMASKRLKLSHKSIERDLKLSHSCKKASALENGDQIRCPLINITNLETLHLEAVESSSCLRKSRRQSPRDENPCNKINKCFTGLEDAGMNNLHREDMKKVSSTLKLPIECNESDPSQKDLEVLSNSEKASEFAMDVEESEFSRLNKHQKEAVMCDKSIPLLVLAGPGSGKTSTMVARIHNLVKQGIHPQNILAMTFTTAAAKEMRDRLAKTLGKISSKEMTISTFHSLCLQLCRENASLLGRTEEFLIYGSHQQRKAVAEAVRLAENSPGKAGSKRESSAAELRAKSKEWEQFVAQAKAAGQKSAVLEANGQSEKANVLRKYEEILAACNALDYSDLISSAIFILSEAPAILSESQAKWTHILVDEFQDTSLQQYSFVRTLGSHGCLTIVGDDDQSIFSFNGANRSGFDSFRRDFPLHKEVRLERNYRSTAVITEAANSLIKNNKKRARDEAGTVSNANHNPGDKISVMECRNEAAQVSLILDEITRLAESSCGRPDFGRFAVLYRRQVTGKPFQSAFRERNIPFNTHGVAFYRKKAVRALVSLLQCSLSSRDDLHAKRVFKAFFSADRSEAKSVAESVEKSAASKGCSFLEAAAQIFSAKLSMRFTKKQLGQGIKVLRLIETIQKLLRRENSLSGFVESVMSLMPQSSVFSNRAVLDEMDGKLLNEDEDFRTMAKFLMDDISEFLKGSASALPPGPEMDQSQGSTWQLSKFLEFLSVREPANFKERRYENSNSVTLTTMHQSKGLEWDHVFVVKVNETEIPLMHSSLGSSQQSMAALEEERRLFYVALTRARKRLFLTFIRHDFHRQVLQESRFLRELPCHLLTWNNSAEACISAAGGVTKEGSSEGNDRGSFQEVSEVEAGVEAPRGYEASLFLKRFPVEARGQIASIFSHWSQKGAFKEPQRLLCKVRSVLEERIRNKNTKGNKAVLFEVKRSLGDEEAMAYAKNVLEWMKLPPEQRALFQAERQERFQQRGSEKAMSSAPASSKQLDYLKKLGCTVNPSSKKEASELITKYKSI